MKILKLIPVLFIFCTSCTSSEYKENPDAVDLSIPVDSMLSDSTLPPVPPAPPTPPVPPIQDPNNPIPFNGPDKNSSPEMQPQGGNQPPPPRQEPEHKANPVVEPMITPDGSPPKK